jgi:hypothetical protein
MNDSISTLPWAKAAEIIARNYGVPACTVSMTMGVVLAGLVSGAVRLRFVGRAMPLVMHLGLAGSAVAESTGWLAEIAAPLVREVKRLQNKAAERSNLPEKLSRHRELLDQQAPGTAEHRATLLACRSMVSLCQPYVFSRDLPFNRERDGLQAPVLFPDLQRMIDAGDIPRLQGLAKSFYAEKGEVVTFVAPINPDTLQKMARAPLLSEATNWPVILLPQYGGDFASVRPVDLDDARESWEELVSRALHIRYDLPRLLELAPKTLVEINRFRRDVEESYRERGVMVMHSWPLPAQIRLSATLHLLHASSEDDEVDVKSVLAAAPLIEDARKAQQAFFEQRERRPKATRRKVPKSTTFEKDAESAKAKLMENPEISDREFIRRMGPRPPGHWKAVLRFVRPQLTAKRTDTTDTTDRTDSDDTANMGE